MHSNTNKFVLATIFVCLHVMSNNMDWIECKVNETNNFTGNLHNIGQLNEPEIPYLDNGERMLKEKCLKNSYQNNSFENIMFAKANFEVCVKSLVDVNQLQREINESKPLGEVDVVFKKYCNKTPELKECVLNLTTTMDECLDDNEKETGTIVESIVEALLSFMCHDEGDRIALFYSEGGIDCLNESKITINNCFSNNSFIKTINDTNEMDNLFKFEEKQCKSFSNLQQCVVNELQKCDNATTGNIVESLFKFVFRSTPCFKNINSSGISQRPMTYLAAFSLLPMLLVRMGHL